MTNITEKYGKPKDTQQLRNMIAYDELPPWKKFLHGWRTTSYNIKYPFIYYKLWKTTKRK